MSINIHDQMDRDCYSKDDNTWSEIVVILDGLILKCQPSINCSLETSNNLITVPTRPCHIQSMLP